MSAASPPPCPAPEMGATFTRVDEFRGTEHAAIVYLSTRQRPDGTVKSWRASLVTDEGRDVVGSNDYGTGRYAGDWKPVSWFLSTKYNMYVPPGMEWDAKKGWYEVTVATAPATPKAAPKVKAPAKRATTRR